MFKTSLSSASWGIRVTHNRTILSLFRGSCGKWDCAIHHHANLSNSLLGTYWLGLILLSELKSVLSMVDSSSANMFKPHQNTRIQIITMKTIQSDTISIRTSYITLSHCSSIPCNSHYLWGPKTSPSSDGQIPIAAWSMFKSLFWMIKYPWVSWLNHLKSPFFRCFSKKIKWNQLVNSMSTLEISHGFFILWTTVKFPRSFSMVFVTQTWQTFRGVAGPKPPAKPTQKMDLADLLGSELERAAVSDVEMWNF